MTDSPSQALESMIVEDVSKTFRLPHESVHTLKERALHPFRRRDMEDFRALQHVSFEVRQGEFFGVAGRNGSGKSTLLKTLAGIYAADSGRIRLRGRVATFIELGVGFNPDLTARDNVVINAIMLGLTPAEARERYDSVIDFAELHEFEDLKLKNYSSGMFVRLAFATMIQVDADILLIDEVLAVGDVSFQHKCHQALDEIRDRGRTILFVTHDMPTIELKCDRAMLLERGEIAELGDPHDVSRSYDKLNFSRQADIAGDDGLRRGDGCAEVLDVWVEDEHGLRTASVERHRPCTVHVSAELHGEAVDPLIGFTIGNESLPQLFSTSSEHNGASGTFAAGERVELIAELELPLTPGGYSLSPWVSHSRGGRPMMDHREGLGSITVTGTRGSTALMDIGHSVRLARGAKVS